MSSFFSPLSLGFDLPPEFLQGVYANNVASAKAKWQRALQNLQKLKW